ncbi:MAG: alkaline phosphatase family protein [Candidatus Cybelea sp.]
MYSPYPTPSPTPLSIVASPCVEYSTILDLMASAAPTSSPDYQWQYIAKDTTSIWSAPMAVSHLYAAYSSDPNPAKTGQPFAVDPDAENFVLTITRSLDPTPNPSRPIAELTFITPCLGESDHPNTAAPGKHSFDDGPDWLAYVLNAIGSSLIWSNTAVIVTWDDWGGFYDNYRGPSGVAWPYHPSGNPYSPPPPGHGGNTSDPNEWGFRVPLIMISPYVKSNGYISSTFVSQGAILNFIETVFDLPTHALKGDDATNGSNDLTDMLNLSGTPLNWTILPTHFTPLNDAQCPAPTPSP